MKTLLALLLLIPSLSWGEYYILDIKDIPKTDISLNKFFGIEIGTKFDESLITDYKINPSNPEDLNFLFTSLSRQAFDNSRENTYDDFKGPPYNKDFKSFGIYLDTNFIISSAYLYQEFYSEQITSKLSGILDILNLDDSNFAETSTCGDFKKKVFNAYVFKNNIKEQFLEDYWEETNIKESQLNSFASVLTIKDKNDTVLEFLCVYYLNNKKELESFFHMHFFTKNFYIQRYNQYDLNGLESRKITKQDFDKLLKISTSIDMTGF